MLTSYEIDKKLEPILRQMEKNGVKIDVQLLEKLSLEVSLKLQELTEKIFDDIGHQFNLNSPSQLSEILYKELKIEPRQSGIKYGKQHFSTSAQSLEKIKHLHPSIEKILEYRELAKLKSTYIEPLPKMVDKNQRIHTHYAVDTSTGRLSSKNPNLQNIPTYKKASVDRPIRSAFIAENGCKLIKADYSQIELRIIAHMSHDREMIKTFQKGEDIHRTTAEELGCDRRTAKVVNFGIIYGMSAYGLSATLKIPAEEAQLFIDKYFLTYEGVKKYIDQTSQDALENGYVKTMFGRKREIKELKSPIVRVRNFGIRAAINTPVQGTAADIIKLSMIALNPKFQITNNKQILNPKFQSSKPILNTKYKIQDTAKSSKMILQVHDELVFEIPNDQVDEAVKIIRDKMENVACPDPKLGEVKLKVPLIVDIEVGNNWDEMKRI